LFDAADGDAWLDGVRHALADFFRINVDMVAANRASIVHRGISIAIDFTMPSIGHNKWQKIFTAFEPKASTRAIGLALGDHVAAAQHVAPVVKALFDAGAVVANGLDADAVLWQPAYIVTDTAYFVDAIDSYDTGGAFPAIATVDFDYDASRSELTSKGLHWFAGQELVLRNIAAPMNRVELMKRAVRLCHDIAVNGPVLIEQTVRDLDPDAAIYLYPDRVKSRIYAEIKNEPAQTAV
jgi:hypothetical protein